MFERDRDTRTITMHQGDTGSYRIRLVRTSGESFGADDRMLYTVAGPDGVVMQRVYRLDRENLNGVVDVEFHNDDTQDWSAGTYNVEIRALVNAHWNIAQAPTEYMVDLLRMDGAMVDGDVVRTNRPDDAWTIEVKDTIGEV